MKFKDIRSLLSQSLEYKNNNSVKSLKDALLVSVILYLLFVFLEPFGLTTSYNKHLILILFSGMYGVVYFINAVFIFPAFNKFFNISRWYLHYYILSYLWIIVMIAFFHHLLQNFINQTSLIIYDELFNVLGHAFFIGLIPSALLGLWAYIQFLKGKLDYKETSFSELLTSFSYSESNSWLLNETSSKLALKLNNILFLKSDDNYVVVHYKSKDFVSKEMLRGTLKSFEHKLNFPFLRVHRSYIVNFNKVKKMEGTMYGLKLWLEGVQKPIPVSKTYSKTVIDQLKNH